MKGRITCPKCGQHIIAEINKNVSAFTLDCPKCNHHFKAKTSQVDLSNVNSDSPVDVESDCYWEEHGEPRKTILSSIKPRTDKPMIASFLLFAVILIAVISAFFPTMFLHAPMSVASFAGVNGDLVILFDDASVINTNHIMLSIDQENVTFMANNDSFTASSLRLGEHEITIELFSENVSNQSVTKQVYILPFDLSTYTVRITESNPLTLENSTVQLGWITSILLILSGVTFIAAIMCWKRKNSDVALIGSIFGMVTIGIYFSGLILSIIALWLILKSRDEFDDGKKGKSF
jgi:hypothetical protein